MAKTITVIPSTINPLTRLARTDIRKRRTAGYARVSTDSDEQFTSYEAQIDYYTKYITSHQDWEFVKVYTDEGITGTSTKRRTGFNEMIEDALAGKIDLIVTKSVSRFARNTVDSLVTIRKLKEVGCECFFEKEGIYTFDSKGELLLTIMSSLAQEESRSISENVTWGQRKRFSDGKVSMPYKQFLGYEKGPNGIPVIVPEQAEIVRRIYSLYMAGKTTGHIAKTLTAESIPTPAGKQRWQASTIESILTNEKYKGCALLQKRYTVDFLTKKMEVNTGQVPQYFIEDSHEAIIQPEEWEAVQAEFRRRKSIGRNYSGHSVLATKIVCGDCGNYYGVKTWHPNTKSRREVLQCNRKFSGEHKCESPTLDEQQVKERFLAVFNRIFVSKDTLLSDCQVILHTLTACEKLDAQIAEITREIEVVVALTQQCIKENAHSAQDQESYVKQYNSYVRRYEALTSSLAELEEKKTTRLTQAKNIEGFMSELSHKDAPLEVFDDRLWLAALDCVVAHSDGRLVFKFYGDIEVEG